VAAAGVTKVLATRDPGDDSPHEIEHDGPHEWSKIEQSAPGGLPRTRKKKAVNPLHDTVTKAQAVAHATHKFFACGGKRLEAPVQACKSVGIAFLTFKPALGIRAYAAHDLLVSVMLNLPVLEVVKTILDDAAKTALVCAGPPSDAEKQIPLGTGVVPSGSVARIGTTVSQLAKGLAFAFSTVLLNTLPTLLWNDKLAVIDEAPLNVDPQKPKCLREDKSIAGFADGGRDVLNRARMELNRRFCGPKSGTAEKQEKFITTDSSATALLLDLLTFGDAVPTPCCAVRSQHSQ